MDACVCCSRTSGDPPGPSISIALSSEGEPEAVLSTGRAIETERGARVSGIREDKRLVRVVSVW